MRIVKWLFPIVLLTVALIVAVQPGLAQEETATPDASPSPAATALQRPTLLSTGLPTPVDPSRATATTTPSLTRTPTRTRTATLTRTPTATQTNPPTTTQTDTATATFTSSPTATLTATISQTPTSGATSTGITETPTATDSPTHTPTSTDTASPTATATLTSTPTETATATHTATETLTPTNTPTPTETAIPINVVTNTGEDDGENGSLNPLLPMIGLLLIAGLVAYVSLYAMNSRTLDRYAPGFVIQQCPVCEVGHLEVEERPYRILGIPRVRRTIRCDNCRSVLREVGRRRWRYAVDPHANPPMYDEYNGDTLTEAQLTALAPETGDQSPHYLDY